MKTSKECRVTRREIDAVQADAQLAQQARAHISVCGPCREAHEQHLRLSELIGSLQPITVPADFDVRLRARLRTEDSSRTSWFSIPRFTFGTRAVAITAAVIVLAGMVVLVNQTGMFRRSAAPADQASQTLSQTGIDQPSAPVIGANQTSQTNSTVVSKNLPATGTPRPITAKAPAKGNAISSYDVTVGPAPSIKRNDEGQNAAEISLKPFEFSLQDSQGVTRKFSLPPVTFGSQQLVRRGPYQSASYSGNRVW